MSHNNLTQKTQPEVLKLTREKIARRYLLKSWKYWNCKVLLVIIKTTITQLNCLFVLYYWSFLCRLMKLLMKWAQFINNYLKSTLRGPITKQFVLQSCFFCLFLCFVLPRHTNIMAEKGFNLFDECTARCVNLFPQEEDCTSSSWGVSGMYTPRSIANSQRMLIEMNKSGTIAKIRIWAEIDTVRH